MNKVDRGHVSLVFHILSQRWQLQLPDLAEEKKKNLAKTSHGEIWNLNMNK